MRPWRKGSASLLNHYMFYYYNEYSELAQRKRVGLITQRSEDRNLDSLYTFYIKKLFHYIFFWLRWDSNPRLRRDQGLNLAP